MRVPLYIISSHEHERNNTNIIKINKKNCVHSSNSDE